MLHALLLQILISQSDEEFFCSPDGSPEGAGDEEFFAAPPSPRAKARAVGRQGRPREPARSDTFGLWMLVETNVPAPSAASSSAVGSSAERSVVGLSHCRWTYRPSASSTETTVARGPGAEVGVSGAAESPDILYEVLELSVLDQPVLVSAALGMGSWLSPHRLSNLCQHSFLVGFDGSLRDFQDASDVSFTNVVVLSCSDWQDLLGEQLPAQLRHVPLTNPMRWENVFINAPCRADINYWRRKAGVSKRRTPEVAPRDQEPVSKGARAALRLPRNIDLSGYDSDAYAPPAAAGAQRKRKMDPIRALDAISFSLKLKQVAEFSDALDDAHVFNWRADHDPPPRDRSNDPGRTEINRAKGRADAVGMLVERRIWQQEVAEDNVESIHCFSDGSPVVGAELQGMIAEVVHRDRTVRKITLPGSTLHYGHCDAINKTIAFLWALWLVCGPLQSSLDYFLDHVRSFTTDGGIELGTALCPYVLPAFMAWIDGRPLENCRVLVNHSRKLFRRCLRIIGWNHTCGGIMKSIANVCPSWPELLEKCRRCAPCYATRHGGSGLPKL